MAKNIKKRSASHIYFGVNKLTGELKHISEVPSGQKCNCICAACLQPFEARKGTRRRHHFAHVSNYECKERIIPFNPCDNCKIPKREKKEMHVLPQDKIGAYLDEAKRLGVYALFYLELTSGLRRGELLGLEWADLNPETRMLTVNKQLTRSGGELCISVPKTENSIRTIALPENTVALLIDEHNKHPDSPLMFWCPRTNGYWSPDSLRHLHKQMLAAAGVDESVRFHDLRHTFSTLAIQSGVDAKTVAGMLGHYSAAFTLDTYTHVTEQMKRGAAEKIGVFMNASVNVQVNVVHSPSAVVRGDYESDLANCLNPSNSTDLDPTSQ